MFVHDLLRALTAEGVPYCVVGGVAVSMHGIPRMTYDIDLVIEPTTAALEAFERIASQLGLRPRIPVRLVDFANEGYRNEMKEERNLIAVTFTDPSNPLNEVDVLVSPAVPAEALIARAVTMNLDDLPVRVVSRTDLVRLKRSSDRKQDATDADHLERLMREKP